MILLSTPAVGEWAVGIASGAGMDELAADTRVAAASGMHVALVYVHSMDMFLHLVHTGLPSSHLTRRRLQVSHPFFDFLWNLRLPVDVLLTVLPFFSMRLAIFVVVVVVMLGA